MNQTAVIDQSAFAAMTGGKKKRPAGGQKSEKAESCSMESHVSSIFGPQPHLIFSSLEGASEDSLTHPECPRVLHVLVPRTRGWTRGWRGTRGWRVEGRCGGRGGQPGDRIVRRIRGVFNLLPSRLCAVGWHVSLSPAPLCYPRCRGKATVRKESILLVLWRWTMPMP